MRLLHTMLRVGNLQRSIDFYTKVLGMNLLRTSENPEYKYSLAFIGYGYLLRQEWRRVNADDPEERMRADERRRRAALRKPSDAEDEDALLDAAGR